MLDEICGIQCDPCSQTPLTPYDPPSLTDAVLGMRPGELRRVVVPPEPLVLKLCCPQIFVHTLHVLRAVRLRIETSESSEHQAAPSRFGFGKRGRTFKQRVETLTKCCVITCNIRNLLTSGV